MSSAAFANYSNTVSSLRSTIQGQSVQEGQETEDDRKAFMQEMLQTSSQYNKEKAIEGAPAALAGFPGVNFLSKKLFSKDLTPLKTKAAEAKTALKAAQNRTDAEGLAEKENIAMKGDTVQRAQETKNATAGARETAQAEVDDTQATVDRLGNFATNIGSTQGADDAATTAAATARAALATKTAADDVAETGLSVAKDAQTAAKVTADASKALRVEKLAKDAKDIDVVAEGAEETGDPFAVVFGAVAAAVAGALGAGVHVHSAVQPPPPDVSQMPSFGATIGA